MGDVGNGIYRLMELLPNGTVPLQKIWLFKKSVKNITNKISICHKQVNNDTKTIVIA